MSRLRAAVLAAALAAVASACGNTAPSSGTMAVFDSGVVLVVENRTNGPLDLADMSVAACSEQAMALEDALKVQQAQRLIGFTNTPHPVDLSKREIKPGTRTIIVVTATGGSVWPEPLDRAALPACAGEPPAS